MTAAIVLTLILNGQQPFIAKPIMAGTDAQGTQRIAVPVRNVFEAAGFVVEYRDGAVDVTGYADRLPEGRRLVRRGRLFLDRPAVRCEEYTADLPFPVETIDGTLYAPAIVLRIIAGGDLSADLDAGTLRWDLHAPDDPPTMSIGGLLADLPRWLHRRVRIEGAFVGSEGDPAHATTSIGAPAPGAWAVADGSGAIYCTDVIVVSRTFVQDPGLEFARRVAVEGVVRPGWGGLPYLSQAEAIPL